MTDPRTAMTLVLFEEFVPLEYREQLAIKSSSRRRLPSLFSSSSGKKHWKPAATLNGRPYVVGHVPLAPSPREVEFDGLLHGNNSTRILSLGPKRSMGGLARLENGSTTTGGGERTLAPPMIRVPVRPPERASAMMVHRPKSDDTHSNSNSDITTVPNPTSMLPPGTASPSIKKSLFRPNRKSMIPAEYSTVEFQTRMASYSDDEANGDDGRDGVDEPEDVKQRRRESSADAWVDILVGSQDRLGSQSAAIRSDKRAKHDRKSDPDLASKEVEKVLASMHNLRAPSPGSSLFVDKVRERDYGGSDTDVVEVETVPRLIIKKNGYASNRRRSLDSEEESSQAHTGGDEADEAPPAGLLNARQVLRQQRRLGYFDLHPERRGAHAQSIMDDDPRERLAGDSDDEDGNEYGSGEGSDYAHTDRVRRPLPIPPGGTTAILTTTMPTTKVIHEPSPVTPVKSIIQSLNQSPEVNKAATSQISPNSPGSVTSKTAALIEMYRERERGGSNHALSGRPSTSPGALGAPAPISLPVTPLAPSRLPVRSSSVPKETPVIPPPPTVPAPVLDPVVTTPPKVTPVALPPTLAIPEPEDQLNIETGIEPRLAFDEAGRASPGRYVHGAPLHNVIEEEEEYDD